MKKFSILLFVCAVVVGSVGAATVLPPVEVHAASQWYVSPNGSSGGSGSQSSPWDLQTALNQPSSVHAGDTIWLLGGTYFGTFTSNLNGTASSPIIVRNYNGQRATIDGGNSNGNPVFLVSGSYTWLWGLEVMSSSPVKDISGIPVSLANYWPDSKGVPNPSWPKPSILPSGEGMVIDQGSLHPGMKFINCIVHDTRQGFSAWQQADQAEYYGNVVYDNGWTGPDRPHGHGIYIQTIQNTGSKTVADNIFLRAYSTNIDAYAESGFLDGITFNGNVAVNGGERNFLLGATAVAQNPVIENNMIYLDGQGGAGTNMFFMAYPIGYGALGTIGAVVTGNYMAGGTLTLNNNTNMTFSGNTIYDTSVTNDPIPSGNAATTAKPATSKVFIRPNKYEAGRANIVAYWQGTSPVSVDPTGILSLGNSYTVQDAQNYFGPAVASGIWNGGTISIPLGGTLPPKVGNDSRPISHTSSDFAVYVLMRTTGGPISTDTTAPSVTLNGPQNGTSVTGSVSLSASASDVDDAVSSVTFYDGSTIISTDTTSPYQAIWNTASLPNGSSHVLSAKACDTHGNCASTPGITVTVVSTVGADTTAPTITPTAPAVGATLSGTATLSATASDPDDAVSSLSFYVDGSLLSTDTTSPYTASWDTTSVSNGSHTLSEKACDTHSNCATTQGYAVTVSNTALPSAPSVSLTAPSSGATVQGTVTLAASASAHGTGATLASVQFFVDGTSIGTDTTSPYTLSWNTSGLPAGSSHTLTVKATDSLGNTATSQPVTVLAPAVVGGGAFTIGDTIRVVLTTDCLNARDNPTIPSNIYKCEVAGAQGTVLAGPSPDAASGYTFWKIAYSDGTTGWSDGSKLEKVSSGGGGGGGGGAFTIGDTIRVVLTTDCLNARDNPTIPSNIYKCEVAGAQGTVLAGPSPDAASGYTFWKIAYSDGTTGWSDGSKLEKVSSGSAAPVPPVSTPPVSTPPPPTPPSGSSPSLSVYQDSLLSPWQKASFRGVYTYNSTAQVHSGSASIKAVSQPTGSVSFQSWTSPQSISGYTTFQFWVYPTTPITLHTTLQGPSGLYGAPTPALGANQWTEVSIPLANYKLPAGFQLTRIYIGGIGTATTWYLDDVGFGTGQ